MTTAVHDENVQPAQPVSPSTGPPQPAGSLAPGRTLRPRAKVLPEQARSHNRSLVLQTIYRSPGHSRADIARETGLTKVTVSDLVTQLLADDLVYEIGQRETIGPGKPAVLLDINRSGHQILGIDLSDHNHFRGAVLDLDGQVVSATEIPLEGAIGEPALAKAYQLVDHLKGLTETTIMGIGVGSPGVVDSAGTILTAPNLGWRDLPLQRLLAEHTQLPVAVANDANVAALAEYSYGEASGDLILIQVGHGIGAGIMIADTLVLGSHFAAGEIGQVMVGTDLGLDATYTRSQVLENWLSVPRLRSAIAIAENQGRDATPILRETGQRLGIALAPVVGMLNLSEIVLSGPADLIQGTLAEAVVQTLRNRTMPENHADLTVRMTNQGRDIVLRGTAALIISRQLGIS